MVQYMYIPQKTANIGLPRLGLLEDATPHTVSYHDIQSTIHVVKSRASIAGSIESTIFYSNHIYTYRKKGLTVYI